MPHDEPTEQARKGGRSLPVQKRGLETAQPAGWPRRDHRALAGCQARGGRFVVGRWVALISVVLKRLLLEFPGKADQTVLIVVEPLEKVAERQRASGGCLAIFDPLGIRYHVFVSLRDNGHGWRTGCRSGPEEWDGLGSTTAVCSISSMLAVPDFSVSADSAPQPAMPPQLQQLEACLGP